MAKKFESISEAQVGFALELLRSQYSDEKSTVFSPVSIASALVMVYLGAKDKTAEQMKDALAKGIFFSVVFSSIVFWVYLYNT